MTADVIQEALRANGSTPIRAPRGTQLNTKGWVQEAALRMLMNNLDPEVAERPQDLVVYGGIGKAARNWPAFRGIVRALLALNETSLLVVALKSFTGMATIPKLTTPLQIGLGMT